MSCLFRAVNEKVRYFLMVISIGGKICSAVRMTLNEGSEEEIKMHSSADLAKDDKI